MNILPSALATRAMRHLYCARVLHFLIPDIFDARVLYRPTATPILARCCSDACPALLPHVHRAWRPLMASLREHLTPLPPTVGAGEGGWACLRNYGYCRARHVWACCRTCSALLSGAFRIRGDDSSPDRARSERLSRTLFSNTLLGLFGRALLASEGGG